MYTLIKQSSGRDLIKQQAPALVGAFVVASLFYKFGSFALECVAFLATWAVFDGAISAVRGTGSPRPPAP